MTNTPATEDAQTWKILHGLALAALLLRLSVALFSERISYPDELFQYLEQAHRYVFGYGFETWEYRYGIRNWLLPGFLSSLLATFAATGLDMPKIYVPAIKSIVCIISVSTVYASYYLGRNLLSEQTGRMAALLAAIWYEALYYAVVATPEVLSSYALFGAAALATGRRPASVIQIAGVSMLLGLGVALRIHYAPAAMLVLLYAWLGRCADRKVLLIAPGALVFLFAGWLDYLQWGHIFYSFYNSFRFNVVLGISNIFGEHPLYWYIYSIGKYSASLFLLALAYAVFNWRRYWVLLVLALSVVGPHSLIVHKEHRFIFLATLTLLVLAADLMARLISHAGNPGSTYRRSWVAAVIVVLLTAGAAVQRGVFSRENRLQAMLHLSDQKNVAAVLDLAGPWYLSGGFYYLHKNVPYYFPEQTQELSNSEFYRYVSHVVAKRSAAVTPGFSVLSYHGDVMVLAQPSPPADYLRLPFDGRRPVQPGIDGEIQPDVRARF